MMNHHQLIRALIQEIRDLREQIGDEQSSMYYAEKRVEKYRATAEGAEYKRAEAERQADYHRWEIESAVTKLERAQRYGNDYEIAKATRQLKSLT